MSIQFRIRNWFGIFNISDQLTELKNQNQSIRDRLVEIKKQQIVIANACGRIVAKLDATYAQSEFDPARKAESDKLAEETIKRLAAEAAARAPYND